MILYLNLETKKRALERNDLNEADLDVHVLC